MTNLFKIILPFFLLITLNCFGQNSVTEIDARWDNLKMALIIRSEIFINFSDYLSKSGKINIAALKESKESASALINELNKLSSIDSLSINLINNNNIKLTNSFKKVLEELKSKETLKNKKKTIEYTMQLEGGDNRIYIEKITFNKVCRENNKTNLIFGDDIQTNIVDSYYLE
jgi:hypothetical protein